ncbi:MAG: hypothetical protein ACK4H7_04850, partial [Acidilobaceae archaeon]
MSVPDAFKKFIERYIDAPFALYVASVVEHVSRGNYTYEEFEYETGRVKGYLVDLENNVYIGFRPKEIMVAKCIYDMEAGSLVKAGNYDAAVLETCVTTRRYNIFYPGLNVVDGVCRVDPWRQRKYRFISAFFDLNQISSVGNWVHVYHELVRLFAKMITATFHETTREYYIMSSSDRLVVDSIRDRGVSPHCAVLAGVVESSIPGKYLSALRVPGEYFFDVVMSDIEKPFNFKCSQCVRCERPIDVYIVLEERDPTVSAIVEPALDYLRVKMHAVNIVLSTPL